MIKITQMVHALEIQEMVVGLQLLLKMERKLKLKEAKKIQQIIKWNY